MEPTVGTSNHPQLINDLLDELRDRARIARYPREVRLIETHVSWVLLGPEVYKIKKPVRLPFLDFGSLERRALACREELVVNRRLAPRTYLGVVPIRRQSDGRATLGNSGPIVEWAVQMERRDEALGADALLERGTLTREMIDRVAVGVAAFHADAPSSARIASFGAADAIEANVTDNFAALGPSSARFIRDDEAWELERWQLAFLRGHRDLFEKRIRTGAIRDGHGDLRLEHVFFLPDGDFEIIDGIEFDARYRCADVCADIAFLSMDLARFGRVDLAERLLASYARASNDYDIFPLVDFYESYRACVRAKIAVLVAADPTTSDAARERAEGDARRYLLLALSASRRSLLLPALVVVGGGIAAGKSTVAERLADELGAPIVDADRTRKHMLGLAPTQHADSGAWSGPYDPSFSEDVYAEVLRRADAVLASGRPVVVDASFRTKRARAAARGLAEARGVPFRFVECVAPAGVCRERLAHRDRETAVSDGRIEVYDAFRVGFEPVIELCDAEHVVVDTTRTLETVVTEAKRHIGTWPRGLVA